MGFQIGLVGSRITLNTPAPVSLKRLGLDITAKKNVSVTIDVDQIKFRFNSTVTDWLPAHQFKLQFDFEFPPEKLGQILFRYRLAHAGNGVKQQRLRVEMLILPDGSTYGGLSPAVKLMTNSPCFPANLVTIVTQPLEWLRDESMKQSSQFAKCFVVVHNENPWTRENLYVRDNGPSLREEDFRKPVITSQGHARLLYEPHNQLSQATAHSTSGSAQKTFWDKVAKTEAKLVSVQPVLYLSSQSRSQEQQAMELEDEFNSEWFDVTQFDSMFQSPAVKTPPAKKKAIKEAVVVEKPQGKRPLTASAEKPPAKKQFAKDRGPDLAELAPQPDPAAKPTGAVAKKWDPVQFVQRCRTKVEVQQGLVPQDNSSIHKELVPVYSQPANYDMKPLDKGKKTLFKFPLRLQSRWQNDIKTSKATLSNIQMNTPKATEQDAINILSDMNMSLTKHSHASLRSVRNSITRVMGSEEWLLNPHPSDRELILSRLTRCGSLKTVSATQYLKSYGAILTLEGKQVPKPTETFSRMKVGLKKAAADPIKDVAAEHRRAHNLPSLRIASAAFADMKEKKLWTAHKAQTCHTILMLCFWGRLRVGEALPPANNYVSVLETLLLSDIEFCTDKEGKEFLRLWLRKEKNIATFGAAVVELPKLPISLADICPVRAMRTYVANAVELGLSQFDPLFTEPSGYVVTPAKFSRLVDQAVRQYIPDDLDLFQQIKNHSCRSGVVTAMATYDVHLSEEITKHLGRWHSSAYTSYQKSFGAALSARRVIENELVSRIEAGQKDYVNKVSA